jgi:hypothetical protein
MSNLAVYLHAVGGPDYVTEDLRVIDDVVERFGWRDSQLVFANELANVLSRSPIKRHLADTEDSTMVRVDIAGRRPD